MRNLHLRLYYRSVPLLREGTMLVLVIDNDRSDTSFASDVRVLDHVQLPAALSCNPKFIEWIANASAGDVYQIGSTYIIVKLGTSTGQ